MMKSIIVKLSLAAFALASSSALACIPITQADVPLTINQTGTYCFSEDLQGMRNATAVTILADNVTLDLKGYTLKGGTSGVASRGSGVIIKNGTIANARTGVGIFGANYSRMVKNNIVENVNFVNLTGSVVGINYAKDVKLLNNSMSLIVSYSWADVISAQRTDGLHIKNNSISMRVIGLDASATAFRSIQSNNVVIENNSFFGQLTPRDNALTLFRFNGGNVTVKNNNSNGVYTFAVSHSIGRPKVLIGNTIVGSSLNAFPSNPTLIDGGGNQFFR